MPARTAIVPMPAPAAKRTLRRPVFLSEAAAILQKHGVIVVRFSRFNEGDCGLRIHQIYDAAFAVTRVCAVPKRRHSLQCFLWPAALRSSQFRAAN